MSNNCFEWTGIIPDILNYIFKERKVCLDTIFFRHGRTDETGGVGGGWGRWVGGGGAGPHTLLQGKRLFMMIYIPCEIF